MSGKAGARLSQFQCLSALPILGRTAISKPAVQRRADDFAFRRKLVSPVSGGPPPSVSERTLCGADAENLDILLVHPRLATASAGSTLVTLRSSRANQPGVFRPIETIADLLAEMLAGTGYLKEFYEFSNDSLLQLPR
jgi:hypothetical protein